MGKVPSLAFLLHISILFPLVSFASPELLDHLLDKTLVTVNEDVLLLSEFLEFERRLPDRGFQETFGIDPHRVKTRDDIIQFLIEEKLVNQQIKKLELVASDKQIDAQVEATLAQNHITLAQLESRLKSLHADMTQFRFGVRRQIERKNLVDREIKPSLDVSNQEMQQYYESTLESGVAPMNYQVAEILVRKRSTWKEAERRAQKIYVEGCFERRRYGVVG